MSRLCSCRLRQLLHVNFTFSYNLCSWLSKNDTFLCPKVIGKTEKMAIQNYRRLKIQTPNALFFSKSELGPSLQCILNWCKINEIPYFTGKVHWSKSVTKKSKIVAAHGTSFHTSILCFSSKTSFMTVFVYSIFMKPLENGTYLFSGQGFFSWVGYFNLHALYLSRFCFEQAHQKRNLIDFTDFILFQGFGELLFGLTYLPTAQRLSFSVLKGANLRYEEMVERAEDFRK